MPVDLTSLTIDDFHPLLNQTFTLPLEQGGEYVLELFEVKDLGEAPLPAGRRPFSLLFRNARLDVYLPQRTYLLHHPVMDGLLLFLVPLGPQGGVMVYQAIIA